MINACVMLLAAVACSTTLPQADGRGIRTHLVESPHQATPTKVKVLLPPDFDQQKRYPVVYLLPVEAAEGSRYGDPLAEVVQQRLHHRHAAIFVVATFSHLPWYADHPSDQSIQQETYLLKTVLPLVEANYPTRRDAAGRLLLGFSKSGWGAWSLLLRHPETFARAAAWDAPLAMHKIGKYGNRPIFGTQENFERYCVFDLLAARGEKLGESPRLILTGYGNFRAEHEQAHARLQQLKVPHVYRDGPKRKHDWHSGWVAEALELLLEKPPEEGRGGFD